MVWSIINAQWLLVDETMDEIVHQLRAQRRCVQCQQVYRELMSMGRLQCRRHTGEVATMYPQPGVELGTWSCCGVSDNPHHRGWRGREAALGCRGCDHTDNMGIPPSETLPMERAQAIFGSTLEGRATIYNRRRREVTILRAADGVR